MNLPECDNAIQEALTRERPKKLVHLINRFLQKNAKAKQSLDFVCLMCQEEGPEGKARAFFSAPPPTIVFCANRLHSAREVEETMMHELIHAYDFVVRTMDITNPSILACSEIRAARESECYQKAFALQKLLPESKLLKTMSEWKNKRCVRRHAIRSTQSMFPDEAVDDVDKMLEMCYSDQAPFDKSDP
uniref:Mitochondrial inner membrane protease ATP23 n=1 Tax=Albugo laibachii Nc14 TaxID=890382 RepID=F0W8X6_9STRA|nr:metalloprotease family M76 putative [Albugo laibachii Nc14]|eukprot:CCA17587.1 metalloprotease family M76 putative [Albugo laibachii Nc14]